MRPTPYSGSINPEDPVWRRSKWTRLLRQRYNVVAPFCRGRTVIDTCCGSAWGTASYLAGPAERVFCLDMSPPVQRTVKEANIRFVRCRAERMPLKSGIFDVVLGLDSLEHFAREDGIRYLQEMKRICKVDGIVIGTTPLVAHSSFLGIFESWNSYHLHLYTPVRLRNALAEVFTSTRIFKIYNSICPYFLFTGTSSLHAYEAEVAHLARRLQKRRAVMHCANAYFSLYLLLILIKRNQMAKAARYLIDTLRSGPGEKA